VKFSTDAEGYLVISFTAHVQGEVPHHQDPRMVVYQVRRSHPHRRSARRPREGVPRVQGGGRRCAQPLRSGGDPRGSRAEPTEGQRAAGRGPKGVPEVRVRYAGAQRRHESPAAAPRERSLTAS
jgi:hypothetical protein